MEHEKKEEALQKEIDRYRSEKTKLETEKKMKQDRMVSRWTVSVAVVSASVLLFLNISSVAVILVLSYVCCSAYFSLSFSYGAAYAPFICHH